MSLKVRDFLPEDSRNWDDFVLRHPHGSPFHLTAWKKTIETTFGYQPHYLAAVDDGRLCGVLPLFLLENLFMGKVLISSPFAVYGGIVADSAEARDALRNRLAELGTTLQVQHVELRNAWPEQCVDFSRISRYVTFTQPVGPQDDESLLQSLPKKTRNMVRKALKSPYETRPATDLRAFYDLLSRNYRRLGTPTFPRHYFATLCANFGKMVDVREILLDGKVVAVSLNFFFGDQMHTYYAASDPEYLAMAPNNYLYFDHLRWAGQNGYGVFDFGRSKRDTGTFEFKRHWPTTMRELPYEVLLVKRKELPNFSPKNPKFSLAIRMWQKIPLPVTRALGPRLVRLFP